MKAVFHIFVACLLVAFVSGCDSGPKSKISAVLTKDNQVCGRVSSFEAKDQTFEEALPTYIAMIDRMVKEQRAINLSGCPPEFITAYIAHVRTWEDMAQTLRLRPNVPAGMEAFMGAFLRGMQGDITGGYGELQGQLRTWANQVLVEQNKIRDSWRKVEDIAIQHGAQLP